MTQEEYIEHEVKLRVHHHVIKSLNYKMNVLIIIAITGLAMPMLLKYFGV